MGEAIIVGRCSSRQSGYELKTEIITTNTTWTVPKVINQTFAIRIFGGGGSGLRNGGGGGGFMNNAQLILNNGDYINIIIGEGGIGSTGGTTSFGFYLSANGGTNGYSTGGDGGSGGGGGRYGGTGYQFGGGGANNGGYGGKWGGGGGGYKSYGIGGCLYENASNPHEITGYSNLAGNGGNSNINAENGTNTIGLGLEFEGAGLAGNINGNSRCCGGGGYGGNGGITDQYYGSGGGGGGHGGNGGNYCGGGGGYGADGGDSAFGVVSGGGGGGYGKAGHGGSFKFNSVTNESYIISAGFAAGGAAGYIHGTAGGNGGSGICIIQYYT